MLHQNAAETVVGFSDILISVVCWVEDLATSSSEVMKRKAKNHDKRAKANRSLYERFLLIGICSEVFVNCVIAGDSLKSSANHTNRKYDNDVLILSVARLKPAE